MEVEPKEPDIIMASSPVRYGTSGQTPHRSVLVRKGSRPGSWIVPDMKGFEMRQVLDVCGRMKCDLSFKGTGLVTGQEPKPGTILNEGAAVTVSLEGQSL